MQSTDTIALAKDETEPTAGLDLNQLIKALIEMSIARKNVLFYPGRHRQVKKASISRTAVSASPLKRSMKSHW